MRTVDHAAWTSVTTTGAALPSSMTCDETADGDMGRASLEGWQSPPPLDSEREGPVRRESVQGRPHFIDLPLPDLRLPDPALVVPSSTSGGAAPVARRRSILSSNGSSSKNRRSPSRTLSPTSPKALFGLQRTGTLSPEMPAPVPLRPILQNPLTPSVRPNLPGPLETDTTASIHRERSPSPVFAPREDDEPHPEHGAHHEQRTPHPLYTPAPKRRRRRRRKNGSVASGRSSRSGKSARSRVKRALRKVKRRRRRGSTAGSVASGTASSGSSTTTSSGSSTSSSSSSSSSSGRSNSTWAGWRFWRNSSSGSSSSSDDSGEDTDSEWDPPTPHFKLLTPVLSRPTLHYPAHLFSGALPTPAASTPQPALAPDQASPVFELADSAALAPQLERLSAFWRERQQEDGIAGDLGAGIYNPGEAPLQDMPPEMAVSDGYFPPGALERDAAAAASRADDSPLGGSTPAVTPGVLAGPSTKRGREQARTARLEFRRLGKNKEQRNGPAWWLDIMCPSVADMRDLRKVRDLPLALARRFSANTCATQHLPLHPLTIEDILHQETREKLESFPALGYYFIVFRALDESYFKYTTTTAPPSAASSTSTLDEKKDFASQDSADSPEPLLQPRQRGRVDIVEGVGGKEGVEGVGVGAVNMYLVVYGDGILSVSVRGGSLHGEEADSRVLTVPLRADRQAPRDGSRQAAAVRQLAQLLLPYALTSHNSL